MNHNPVKRTLAAGGLSPGIMVILADTPAAVRRATAAGADWALMDLDWTRRDSLTRRILDFANKEALDLTTLVRVPDNEKRYIAGALAAGATGVLVPSVHSESDARAAVASAQILPGSSSGPDSVFFQNPYGDDLEQLGRRNAGDEIIVAASIDTVEATYNSDAIASVDAIDILWIDPGDWRDQNGVSISRDREHPEFLAAVERVMVACKTHGKSAGIMAAYPKRVDPLVSQGFRFIGYLNERDKWGEGISALRDAANDLSSP